MYKSLIRISKKSSSRGLSAMLLLRLVISAWMIVSSASFELVYPIVCIRLARFLLKCAFDAMCVIYELMIVDL